MGLQRRDVPEEVLFWKLQVQRGSGLYPDARASIDFDIVRSQLEDCFARIFDSFAILINVEDIELIQFPDKIGLFIQIKIPYKGPLMPSGSLPKIKLDLSKEEILVSKPERLPLIHGYSDQANCDTNILCYSLYEIFAEKLRALIERTRPRDLYDVIHLGNLFKKEELDISIFNEVARQKFEHKGMQYPESLSQISELAMSELETDWEIMLSHQVRDMETMGSYVAKYEDLRTWIIEPLRRTP